MSLNVSQRKRGGRTAKNPNTFEKSPSHNEILENSAVAISPSLEELESTSSAPVSECRRSSRKKIIKFDVRDLLNKNRKTHKIQIEARIDSNAPSTSKAASGEVVEIKSSSTSREDLLSKRKTFLEKSAIFRRYSVSQEQKPPPPLPIPPLLSKSNENKDSGFCGTSSSQEFLSHALIKPKQPTSLIVAQIESNKPTPVNLSKRKGLYKTSEIKSILMTNSESSPIVQQKKRGRPAKIKVQTSEQKSTPNITPEKAKNWKEYKACLARQSSSSNEEKNISREREQSILTVAQDRNPTQTLISKQNFNDSCQSDISRSDNDESFSGFQTSKDDIICDAPVLEKKSVLYKTESNRDINVKDKIETVENVETFKTGINKCDEIEEEKKAMFLSECQDQQYVEKSNQMNQNLDISIPSIFETDKLTKTIKSKGSQKKNLVTCIDEFLGKVDITEENKYDCNITHNQQTASETNEDIAKYEIVSDDHSEESKAFLVISNANIGSKEEHILNNEQKIEKEKIEKLQFEIPTKRKYSITSSCPETLPATQINENVTKIENLGLSPRTSEDNKVKAKVVARPFCEIMEQLALPQFLNPSHENISFSHNPSFSESENASSLSSTRSYKSSQTSTSEELSNVNAERKTPSDAKRSKRLRRKQNDSLNADNTSEDADDSLRSVATGGEKLDFVAGTKCSPETHQSETFATCSKEIIKTASSNVILEIVEESKIKEDALKPEKSDMDSDIKCIRENDSLNEDILAASKKNIKRKSLRNHKDDNIYHKKIEIVEKMKSGEKPLARGTAEDDHLLGEQIEKDNIENPQKIFVKDKKIATKSPTSKERNKVENGKSTSPVNQEIICPEEKNETLIKGETKIHKQNVIYNTTDSKDENLIELCNKDDTSTMNTADNVINQTITEITNAKRSSKAEKTKRLVNEPETCTADLNIKQEVQFEFKKDQMQQKLSLQPTSEHQKGNEDCKSFVLDSKIKFKIPHNTIADVVSGSNIKSTERETDAIECQLENPNKTESTEKKSTKQYSDKKLSLQFNSEKELCLPIPSSSKKETGKSNETIEILQVKIGKKVHSETKSPIQNLTGNKAKKETNCKINQDDSLETNKGDFLLGSKFEIKKETGVEAIEKPSPTTVRDKNKKNASETKHKANKNLVKKIEKGSIETFTINTTMQKEPIQYKTFGKNIVREELDPTSEIMKKKNSKNAQAETEKEIAKSGDLSEKITENTKREEKIKEQISSKEACQKKEGPIHFADRREPEKQQETSLEKSEDSETRITEKPIKHKRTLKDDTSMKLLTGTSIDGENETSTKASETKTKEYRKKTKKVSPERTCRRAVNSPKETAYSTSSAEGSSCILTSRTAEVTNESLINLKTAKHSTAELHQALKDSASSKLQLFSEISTETKLLKHSELSKQSTEETFDERLQGINTASETENLIEDNSASITSRENTVSDSIKQPCISFPTVTKRRGRKQRFKNLHGAEDSEADNSNEKITPIKEVVQQNLQADVKMTLQESCVDVKVSQKSSEAEIMKKHAHFNDTEEPVGVQEDAATNLSTSQIKSVSIETNTLLDILRTVQSNTAAALKANKSPININKTNDEDVLNNTSETNSKEKEFSNPQDSIKNQQDVITFPIIFDDVSPCTTKKPNVSPERSNSNSPLTIKKVTPSPTRSNSASPLTLKKIRRYERRSRRGDDSAHKTLEETFAEIAAQSSKAVLAAKEFEEKTPEELCISNPSVIDENEKVKENFENFEKISEPAEMDLHANIDNKADQVLVNDVPDMEKQPIEPNKLCDDSKENVVSAETTKTTPTRRGRKPKNRVSELPTLIKEKEEIGVKSDEGLRDVSKNKDIKKDVEVKSGEVYDTNKQESQTINESLETSLKENVSDCKEQSFSSITTKETESPTPTFKQVDDKIENKPTKKFNSKREHKDATAEDSSPVIAASCHEKGDEVGTPKQPIKKRDSFLNKSETKSSIKKGTKNVKNDEEDSLNLPKVETAIKNTTTTPLLSKRGRKPKNQLPDTPQSGSKKKNKKDSSTTSNEGDEEKVKLLERECESPLDKLLEEKLAKKTRQRKLKEAFEAALTDIKEENVDCSMNNTLSPAKNLNLGLKMLINSPPSERRELFPKEDQSETINRACITPVDAEEDPDPLKDIEKFIADGVNLLKKDYKLDENTVDDVIQTTLINATEIVEDSVKTADNDIKIIFNTFDTPADTPINTPSVTPPPPKSPSSLEPTSPDENSGVRRSHRIKLITKTPKALVGRGLVKDRERFSIKDDVETKSHYTLDDHLTDLAEVEAKNAKFLKEMEERLSNFQVIKENEYLCERVISREARKMICDCFLTHDEEDRGELGCGEDCLNRLLMIECGSECNVKERCTNKRFQKLLCSPCRVFRTEKKGFGIMADIEILPGEFIMEYVGEVINTEEFEKRRVMYSQEKNRHYYFMALRSDAIIDATIKGNISRFINHSCDPNAETQKWTVNGELRIGFFSRKSIMPGEEITFNYQYQRYGREAQRCYCESSNCTGWIGQEPTSDEGEQVDDEEDETEDEEDEAVTTHLLVQDDEDDSDASVADPEEVQKRLEMAAAQAEVELAPLHLLQEKGKQVQPATDDVKTLQDLNKSDNEEDSKSKFKKLLSKMAEKVAAKQKQSKREQKLQRKNKSKESSSELAKKLRFLEDPDIEDEVQFLKECGLKNQSDTLRLSRLMVRAKLVQTRLNLLEILRNGDFPCRRLFLDYHGLRLLHGWMSEDAGNMQIRLSLLQTLQTLPIANKTVLTDSKVMQVVRTWSGPHSNLSPNEDSSSSNSNSQDVPVQGSTPFEESSELHELQKLALKLNTAWEGLPEIFRIPKKERIEQMKEHEREADRQYAASAETQENTTATDRYRRDRFGRGLNTANNSGNSSNRFTKPSSGILHKSASTAPENLKNLSKAQRRELFAAKVARDEAEKRLAEERREFETKCRFFGLDPKKTRAQDMPFCVNPATGQWFSTERKPITTPPSYAHVQVPVKPKSTDPNDYQLPAICSTLPPQWKYAITSQGKIYFYHIKHRISQWEPPSPAQLQQCELEVKEEESESELTSTAGEDTSDDDDDALIGMDAAQLKAYINRKVEMRRKKRYQRLVDERSISPRREEDRIYNQIEMRKYKENKEKIRKRKEDKRRKRAETIRQTSLNTGALGNITDAIPNARKLNSERDEELGALPIQDYLLSSDEEIDIKAEVNSPLIDKIVEGDKIVDELDALTTKRQLKRPLPPHRSLSEISPLPSSSISALTIAAKQEYKQEYKKRKLEKKEKRKPKEQDAKYRKNKEKFRCEIGGIIVHHLKPYLKETCSVGRIQSNEDFNHLARKLTHFVMIKELKYCESVGQTLVVTESVKSKSREFIKKYMAKYGDVYVKPTNDPDFKDIPFTL